MSGIHTTKLELLRAGPAHNQLLSPLTTYLALCGPGGPRTVQMPYEHRELLTRLARLRYVEGEREIAASQREAELREIGETIGQVLEAMPGLQSALESAPKEGAQLVHLRLALSALELGMVPFEAAIAPGGFPGSGAPLLLRTPTVITREVRRSQPIEVRWNRKPRILFAFATPDGYAPVPAQAHLDALRRALEPFVAIRDTPEQRLPEVRRHLTVLPDASLKAIADACREADYTHVHVLAHGASFKEAGSDRYGVALAGAGGAADIVGGDRLAIALRGDRLAGPAKPPPTVVTLATCDSGAVESVLSPGGSVAHELHDAGIPWVVASQFPLWMSASTIMVEAWYAGVLSGADPRRVLHHLRQRLRTEVPQTHDWASIVAYAVSPWDFDAQIEKFLERQVRARQEVRFERMDSLFGPRAPGDAARPPARAQAEVDAEFEQLVAQMRAEHAAWVARIDALQAGRPAADGRLAEQARLHAKAEALGMRGASEKRLAIVYANKAAAVKAACPVDASPQQLALAQGACNAARAEARRAYEAARDAYLQAIHAEPNSHWVITQFVAIVAILDLLDDGDRDDLRRRYAPWWNAARQFAQWQLPQARGDDRAWVLGTLVELELLRSVYQHPPAARDELQRKVQQLVRQMVEAAGPASFPVGSTRRQLERYRDAWPNECWGAIVEAALRAFDEVGGVG
jgi:hypothetical protein